MRDSGAVGVARDRHVSSDEPHAEVGGNGQRHD